MSFKPELYKGKIEREINNNRSVFSSYSDKVDIVKKYNISEIKNKINNIFNGDDFIYRKKVNIVVDNQVLIKKIIGIRDNNLITIDNEYIPINVIDDIYK